jgi:hypothetical protein
LFGLSDTVVWTPRHRTLASSAGGSRYNRFAHI